MSKKQVTFNLKNTKVINYNQNYPVNKLLFIYNNKYLIISLIFITLIVLVYGTSS